MSRSKVEYFRAKKFNCLLSSYLSLDNFFAWKLLNVYSSENILDGMTKDLYFFVCLFYKRSGHLKVLSLASLAGKTFLERQKKWNAIFWWDLLFGLKYDHNSLSHSRKVFYLYFISQMADAIFKNVNQTFAPFVNRNCSPVQYK